MHYDVLYFGYGANRDLDMMQAIIGRSPSGHPATMLGFELCVQKWTEIKPEVINVLKSSWNDNFKTYCARPCADSRKSISGVVWELTRSERRIIDNWELTGKWYDVFVVQFDLTMRERIQLEVQIISDPFVRQVVSGTRYVTYLNSKEKMWSVARKCRKQFLGVH